MSVLAFLGPADAARFGRVAHWLAPVVRAWWDCPAHCAVWRATVLRRLAEFAREAAEWRDTRWAARLPPFLENDSKYLLPGLSDYYGPSEAAFLIAAEPAPDPQRFGALAHDMVRRFSQPGGGSPRGETGFLLAAAATFWREPPPMSYYVLVDRCLFGQHDGGRALPARAAAAREALRVEQDLWAFDIDAPGSILCLRELVAALNEACSGPHDARPIFRACARGIARSGMKAEWLERAKLAQLISRAALAGGFPEGAMLAFAERLGAICDSLWLDAEVQWLIWRVARHPPSHTCAPLDGPRG